MIMDKGEIVREYKASKRKKEQIAILADLNCVPVHKIEEILEEAGVLKKRGIKKQDMKETKDVMEDITETVPEEAQEEPQEEHLSTAAEEARKDKLAAVSIPECVKATIYCEMVRLQEEIDRKENK